MSKARNFMYFKLSDYTKSSIFNYDDDGVVMKEWITLDSGAQMIERKVNSLSDVFGKVGGLQHLLILIFSMLFKHYTFVTYR